MIEKGNGINSSAEKKPSILEKIRKAKLTTSLFIALSTAIGAGVTTSCNNKNKIENSDNYNSNWDNPIWESAIIQGKEQLTEDITIIRDAGLTFYVVKKGDCLSGIIEKLKKTNEFSYLSDPIYRPSSKSGRNIKGFNTPTSALKPGFYLPIPMEQKMREMPLQEFKQYSIQAINELKQNGEYGKYIGEILKKIDKEDLAIIMTAFARSETAEDWRSFKDKIGSTSLHRRESHMNAYSFSPYHILMEKMLTEKPIDHD